MNGILPMTEVSGLKRKLPRLGTVVPIKTTSLAKEVGKISSYTEDVDLLVTDFNDKAFIYNSGKVDIIKDGNPKTIKFGTKKDAALYLMKVGWKYV